MILIHKINHPLTQKALYLIHLELFLLRSLSYQTSNPLRILMVLCWTLINLLLKVNKHKEYPFLSPILLNSRSSQYAINYVPALEVCQWSTFLMELQLFAMFKSWILFFQVLVSLTLILNIYLTKSLFSKIYKILHLISMKITLDPLVLNIFLSAWGNSER